jgi:undecaprenyl-diphosphatase
VDALDPLFVGLSFIGSFGLVWLVLGVAAALHARRPDLVPVVVGGVLAADLLALAGKHLAGRERPYVAAPDPEPLVDPILDLAFPSGHAATSFAGAALVGWLVPRLTVPAFALAGAVAWSRVYVGVHYPGDILAGAALGLAVALLLRYAVRALRSPGAGPPRSERAPPSG